MHTEIFNLYSPDHDDDGKPRERYEMPRGPHVGLQIEEIKIETPFERERRKDEEGIISGQVLDILKRNKGRMPGLFRRPGYDLE